ncbi:MAG TPA: YHS domain-containing protein [Nitrospirota bacterium]|jgi:YHS domain-containing protein
MKNFVLGLMAVAALAFVFNVAVADCGKCGHDKTRCNMQQPAGPDFMAGSGKPACGMAKKCCENCCKEGPCAPDKKCCENCCCAGKDMKCQTAGKCNMAKKCCDNCCKEGPCATDKKCCDKCACKDGKCGCCDMTSCKMKQTSKDATAQDIVVDPVCGMDVPTADAKYTSEFDGKTYNFCTESCMERFKKDPSKYIGK